MAFFGSTFVGAPFRDGIDQIPAWAKAEHLERVVPQKELRDDAAVASASSGGGMPGMRRLAVLALFVAATFLIANDIMIPGALAFVAAAWLMNVNPPAPDAGSQRRRQDRGKRRCRVLCRMPSHMGSMH